MSLFEQCSPPLALTGQAFDALESSPSDVFKMASVWAQPMVIRQLVTGWPAVKAALEGDHQFVDYLLAFDDNRTVDALRLPHKENGRVFYNQDMTGFNFSRTRLPFRDALSTLLDLNQHKSPETLYVGSTTLNTCLPGFLSQNSLGQADVNPLATLWIGNKSRIAAHYDVPDNVICVVSGKRRVTLFPPEQVENLYVGPLHVTPAGQAISLVDFHEPDFERFPKFKTAIKHAIVVDLMPGDVLYIPLMWWHHIEGQESLNTLVNFWLRGLKEGIAKDFGDYCLERQAAQANKFAHLPNNGLNYAFHIDATKYASFLRGLAEKDGLKRIDATINSVNLNEENGFIESLSLNNGETVQGDFFIDCTGFRGLLIEKALHTGYEDWSHWLPCDSAVAVQTKSVSDPIPYTRCIAHEAGWQWRIPLQHRVGNGMVYCSNYLSDDEVITKLLGNVEGEPLNDPRVIHFRTGRRRKQWNRNCLALGLASGFLEPLESTSIHLIQQGIVRFLRMFPTAGIVEEDVNEFNRQADFDIEHIRDFIILHYHVTQRTDTPFWRHCRQMDVPDSLKHRIDLFQKTARVFREGNELFDDSWQQVMIGQGLVPTSYHPIVDTMSRQELEGLLNGITQQIDRTVGKLPPHNDYIARYYG